MGDEGSGYAVGRAALGAVGRAARTAPGRGRLTGLLLKQTRSENYPTR
ncbi:MAG: hypothetical protein U0133_01340 [Gemmatimonadales bacterium]